MLDQNRDESLEAPKNGAVDQHRAMFGIIRTDVLQIEVLRLLIIQLNRRALPVSANGVSNVEVNFRPVKRAVFLVERIRHLGIIERRPELRLCMIPGSNLTQKLIGPR